MAGDDAGAKERVADVVRAIGFGPVDLGPVELGPIDLGPDAHRSGAAPAPHGTQNSGGPSSSTQEVSGVVQGSARNARAIWVGQGWMSMVP